MLPLLRLAASEPSVRPWPPDQHHHDCLTTSYLSIPLATTGIAAVVAATDDFTFDFRHRRHLSHFPAPARHLQAIQPPTQLHLTPIFILRAPIATAMVVIVVGDVAAPNGDSAPFQAVFWPTPSSSLSRELLILTGSKQPRRRRCFLTTGSGRPIKPNYSHS